MAGAYWSEEELNLLQECVGEVPWPLIESTYSKNAIQNGFNGRTLAAIKHKVYELGLSRHSVGQWIRSTTISKFLGVSNSTVVRWIRSGKLRAKQFKDGRKGSAFYVKRPWIRQFCQENPHVFSGHDVATLTSLLDSESLAQQLSSMHLPQRQSSVKVLCVETGRIFQSMHKAASAVFTSRKRISDAIKNPDQTAAGYHWRKQ